MNTNSLLVFHRLNAQCKSKHCKKITWKSVRNATLAWLITYVLLMNLLSWLTSAARWAWPLGCGMDLCGKENSQRSRADKKKKFKCKWYVWDKCKNLSSLKLCFYNHVDTYLPTVMWKFPATLLTYRCPCILQAVSDIELSSLWGKGATKCGENNLITIYESQDTSFFFPKSLELYVQSSVKQKGSWTSEAGQEEVL